MLLCQSGMQLKLQARRVNAFDASPDMTHARNIPIKDAHITVETMQARRSVSSSGPRRVYVCMEMFVYTNKSPRALT